MNKKELKVARTKLEEALEHIEGENNKLIERQDKLEKELNKVRSDRREIPIQQAKIRRKIKKITEVLIK